MIIAIKATEQQKQVILQKNTPIQFIWVDDSSEATTNADAYFDVTDNEAALFFNVADKPVFKNAVTATGSSLPANYIRINAWPFFFERNAWELSCSDAILPQAQQVLEQLNIKPIIVADKPGLIAAPVIAMIINEAFYTLGEGVSTKEDIDTAMKLGTNYAYGPFEWCDKIGAKNIVNLLNVLALNNKTRYIAAPLLLKAAG